MTLDDMIKNIKPGDKVNLELHPSGIRFDGPATVVKLWWNSFYFGVLAVSDTDPAKRRVTKVLGEIPRRAACS